VAPLIIVPGRRWITEAIVVPRWTAVAIIIAAATRWFITIPIVVSWRRGATTVVVARRRRTARPTAWWAPTGTRLTSELVANNVLSLIEGVVAILSAAYDI